MSANLTSMRDYIDTLRLSVPTTIHPMAQQFIHEWFNEACLAEDQGNTSEVTRLLDLVRFKIVDELRWEAQKYQSVHDYREAYRLRRLADRMGG
jgi:hypothetical protein